MALLTFKISGGTKAMVPYHCACLIIFNIIKVESIHCQPEVKHLKIVDLLSLDLKIKYRTGFGSETKDMKK